MKNEGDKRIVLNRQSFHVKNPTKDRRFKNQIFHRYLKPLISKRRIKQSIFVEERKAFTFHSIHSPIPYELGRQKP